MAYKEIFGISSYQKDGEEKNIWTRIGTAFENKDGSYNLVFDYFPVNNAIIQLRDPKDD